MFDDYSISHGFDDPLRWWPNERSNMFTDAIFSIIATILVVSIPIHEEALSEDGFSLKEALIAHIPKFVAYFACFIIISAFWGCHVRLYKLVINSNDVLTWLNLALLLVLSFLPLTLTLWVDAQNLTDYLAHLPAVNLILACLLITVTIFYVFRERAAHHTNIVSHQKVQRRFILLLYAWFPTLIGLFCIYLYKLAEFALSVVFLLVLLTVFMIGKFERWYLGHSLFDIAMEQAHSPLPMERIEAFSDGVYAISMTLLAVSNAEKMSEHKDEEYFLHFFQNSSQSFVTCFGLVSVLWFVHHQLCHNIERSNPVLGAFNTIALAFVGGVPFTSGLLLFYANPENYHSSNYVENEKSSVRFHCLVLFFSGFFQVLVWLVAIVMKVTTVNMANYSDVLLLFKAMLVPTISCIVYLCSFITSHSSLIFLLLTAFTPFIFALYNLLHRRRQRIVNYVQMKLGRCRPESEGLEDSVNGGIDPVVTSYVPNTLLAP